MIEQPRSFGEGRYQVLEKINEGSFGIVYLVFDTHLKRQAAIKMLKPAAAIHPKVVARFGNERALAARFIHPKCVSVNDFGEEDGRLYEVMEYVEGGCVEDAMMRQGTIPARAACRIALDVLKFLAAFHADERGFIHRDIKPANILLTRDGEVKVTDFGITKVTIYDHHKDKAPRLNGGPGTMIADDELGKAVVLGTPGYMPPEQQAGGEIDGRADLFALGVTLWVMLTGPGGDPGMWHMEFVRSVDHPSLRGVPEPLKSVIVGAVGGLAEDRAYANAREMAVALTKAMGELEPDQSEAFFDRLAKAEVRNQTIVTPEEDSLEQLQDMLHGRTGLPSHLTGADTSVGHRRWLPVLAAVVLLLAIGGFSLFASGFGREVARTQPQIEPAPASIIPTDLPAPALSTAEQKLAATVPPTPTAKSDEQKSKTPTKVNTKSTLISVLPAGPALPPVPLTAPEKVTVTVRNPPKQIALSNSAGTFSIPGQVAPGSYILEATFAPNSQPTQLRSIVIEPGASVRIICDLSFKTCR